MSLVEILIGCAIALIIIVGAVFFAFRTPKTKGPSRHGIKGNGDYAGGHHNAFTGSDGGGGDGGGD